MRCSVLLFSLCAAGCASDGAVSGDPPTDGGPETPSDPHGPPRVAHGTAASLPHFEDDSCSGLAGAPGDSDRSVKIGALQRTFLVHVPADLDPDEPVPLVLVFHGFTMSGQIMDDITTWSAIADREGFVVVYPDGATGATPWNVGDGTCGAGAIDDSNYNDFAFVEAMLDSVAADQCLDRDRVFGSGFSMGGYFVHNLACRGPAGLVRAIAPHSGATYPGDCDNGPIPVLALHGTLDPVIAYHCGQKATEEWIARDGCSDDVDELPIDGGSCEVHQSCDDGASVGLCSFDGMGHGWAGSSAFLYGGGAQYEDAAELSWAFFSQF